MMRMKKKCASEPEAMTLSCDNRGKISFQHNQGKRPAIPLTMPDVIAHEYVASAVEYSKQFNAPASVAVAEALNV